MLRGAAPHGGTSADEQGEKSAAGGHHLREFHVRPRGGEMDSSHFGDFASEVEAANGLRYHWLRHRRCYRGFLDGVDEGGRGESVG